MGGGQYLFIGESLELGQWYFLKLLLVWSSWDIRHHKQNVLSFWAIFCPFTPLKIKKKSKFWRNIKKCWRYHHFACVPKTTIIWSTVPDIRDERHNFLSFWAIFALLPTNNSENQNLKKMKKTSGDVIVLHMCTKNPDHMMYGFSDMKRNRQFLVILGHFLPFYHTKNPKNQNKTWRYHSTQVSQKSWSYAILFLRYGAWWMYCCFSFWVIFSTVSPLTTQKIRILKNEKKHLDISSFYACVWSNDVRFLRYGAQQMDQQRDGKSDIQSWVPHLKILIFFSFANMQVCNINWKNIELWKNRNLKRIHVWYFRRMHIFGRT